MSSPTDQDTMASASMGAAFKINATNASSSRVETTKESSPAAAQPFVLPNHSLLDDDESEDEQEVYKNNNTLKTAPRKDTTLKSTMSVDPSSQNRDDAPLATTNSFSFGTDRTPLLESFVQQATRVRSLVTAALQQQQQPRTHWNKRPHDQDDETNPSVNPPPVQRRRLEEIDTMAGQLAREKALEVMTLKRKLQVAETELSTLKTTHDSLQTEVSSHQQRYERTAERLRLAERNVKQARIDADTAEATSANLATALESLQKIVQDTKDAIANLQATQEEITQKSNYVQADAWQKQVRIACLERENDTLSKDYHKMENAQSSWKEEQTCLQQLLQEKERTIGMHQRQQQERRTLDEARQQRVQRLEDEWRQAQGLLVEATAAEAASVDMQSQLQTNMRELQEKNQDSHEQIQKSQTLARLAQESHHDSLKRAEKEGQQWQIQLEASQDQNERLRLEKVNLQKQISKLRGDLAAKNLSMKQKAETAHFKTAMSSTVSPEGSKTAPSVLDSASKKSVSVMTQSVGSKENSANLARRASNIAPGGCVLCGKPTFGIMKKCQCGSCSQVAHLSCVQRIPGHKTVGLSVSHPGTPAVRPPFILCTPTSKEAAV